MSEENQQFAIQKLYLKDVSFESPNSPQAFTSGDWQPQVNVQINSNHQPIGDDMYEVVLDVTVTAKHDEQTAFLAEVKQAGIFTLSGFPDENMGGMLGAYCPETLFPYAREAISELISKGGFPQLLLTPVNFNALYTQQMQQQAEAPADQGAAH
ncbi:MAG TPA: protein-export chaperone SecB [Gammaproteobacteria bacterium]|nr:protein-export chaperone SecB [Gammaproteobacteria bacterium]